MGLPHPTDDLRPVVGLGRRPHPAAPGAGEHVVHHQHRHVASHAVALFGDPAEHVRGPPAQLFGECVELHHIRPRGEVWIAAVGEDRAADPHERGRVGGQVGVRAKDEPLRMLRGPWVVGRHVVRHEVEDQTEPVGGQGRPGGSQSCWSAQVVVDDVIPDAVRRSDDVVARPARQRRVEVGQQAAVRHRDADAGRAALPDAHQPHGIEAQRGDVRPLAVRNRLEGDRATLAIAESAQPGPGVDLIDGRV